MPTPPILDYVTRPQKRPRDYSLVTGILTILTGAFEALTTLCVCPMISVGDFPLWTYGWVIAASLAAALCLVSGVMLGYQSYLWARIAYYTTAANIALLLILAAIVLVNTPETEAILPTAGFFFIPLMALVALGALQAHVMRSSKGDTHNAST